MEIIWIKERGIKAKGVGKNIRGQILRGERRGTEGGEERGKREREEIR